MSRDACIYGLIPAVPTASLATVLHRLLWKPVRNILQSWRLSLASLLFFTIFLTDNFGISSLISRSVHDHPSPNCDFHNNQHHHSSSAQAGSSTTHWSLSDFFYSNIINITIPERIPPSCLVSYNISRDICDSPVRERQRIMRSLSLVFCGSGYPLYHLIGDSCKIQGSPSECRECFDPIEELDKNVHFMFCHFEEVLSKVDCLTNYSTHWNCNDCKVSGF